jgi:hypothetical protein
MADLTKEIQGIARVNVAAGFDPFERIVYVTAEILTDDYDEPTLKDQVRQVVRNLIEEHLEAQAGWPALTDCDRLDKAFISLELDGILGRQNFCESNTRALEAIRSELDQASKIYPVRGFTFYHQQNTESAAEGQGLYLSYGSARSKDLHLDIGHEVVKQVNDQGLKTIWDGTLDTKIHVSLNWQKRRKRDCK